MCGGAVDATQLSDSGGGDYSIALARADYTRECQQRRLLRLPQAVPQPRRDDDCGKAGLAVPMKVRMELPEGGSAQRVTHRVASLHHVANETRVCEGGQSAA